jgi:hypothetical protein
VAGSGSDPATERPGRVNLNPLREEGAFCGLENHPARSACIRNVGKPGGTVQEAAGMVTAVTSLLRCEAIGCRLAMPNMTGPATGFPIPVPSLHPNLNSGIGGIAAAKGHGFSRAVTESRYVSPSGAEGTVLSAAEAGLCAAVSARLKEPALSAVKGRRLKAGHTHHGIALATLISHCQYAFTLFTCGRSAISISFRTSVMVNLPAFSQDYSAQYERRKPYVP